MPTTALSPDLDRLVRGSVQRPPRLARRGRPLGKAPVDHVALAFESAEALRWEAKRLAERGGRVVEPVLLWPTALAECPEVPAAHRKWMATFDAGPFFVVLLAPASDGDLIGRFLAAAGGRAVHHIAYAVPSVYDALAGCRAMPGVRQVSDVAKDPSLTQVFLRTEDDVRIVELVSRARGFEGTFRCGNTAALTRGEASG